MKKFKRSIVYLASIPGDLVGWLMVLAVWLLWGTGLRWEFGVLSCVIKPKTLPVKRPKGPWPSGWYLMNRKAARCGKEAPRPWGGTTVGHAMFFGEEGLRSPKGTPWEKRHPIEVHEFHHVRQAEAANVSIFVIALVVFFVVGAMASWPVAWKLAGFVWACGGVVGVSAGGWISAWLRSDPRGFYRGSAHEIGAYAVGDLHAFEMTNVPPTTAGKVPGG